MDQTFRRYKVRADVCGGSVARGVKRQWDGQNQHVLVISVVISSELLQFKPILLCSVMKCLIGFPATVKCLTLNDLEMPFYAQTCFDRGFD